MTQKGKTLNITGEKWSKTIDNHKFGQFLYFLKKTPFHAQKLHVDSV